MDWTGARSLWSALCEHTDHAGTERPSGSAPTIPDIKGYTIEARIGSGGGGDVYRARRHADGRLAAVKFIRDVSDGTLSGDPRRRDLAFTHAWREIEIHRDLPPACVPELLDEGLHAGGLWFATEFITGKPIDEYCDAAGLSRRDRARLLAEVCDAVQTLHDRAIIHRDLKPSNILVMPSGKVRIIDFGISARSVDTGTPAPQDPRGESEAAFACGTPAYMAPEQAVLSNERRPAARTPITNRSDVFALGATAYLVFCGEPPRRMDRNDRTAFTMRRVGVEPARHPLEIRSDLPHPLVAVLWKAVQPMPAERYDSARELADDLRRWEANQRVRALPRSLAGRAFDWARDHPLRAGLAVSATIVFMSILLSLVIVWWINLRPYKIDNGRLLAASGRVLADWADGDPYKTIFATLLDRHDSLGGGRLVVVGFGAKQPKPELTAFNAFDPETPLWTSGFRGDRFIAPPREGYDDIPLHFFLNAIVADVFPERPGVEIVASHPHKVRGACCIRIYDLAGTVLYETWHYGYIYDFRWLSGPGTLVMLGVNSEALWKERGWPDAVMTWPVVVFAVRPEAGAKTGWITTPSHPGDLDPLWYRCVMPPDLVLPHKLDRGNFNLGSPGFAMYDEATHFSLCVGLRPAVVDALGVVVHRMWFAHHEQNAGRLMDPELLGSQAESEPELADLPVILDRAEGAPGERRADP